MRRFKPPGVEPQPLGLLCTFFILLAVLLSLIPSLTLKGEDERPTDRVAILYTGETHGNVEPCG